MTPLAFLAAFAAHWLSAPWRRVTAPHPGRHRPHAPASRAADRAGQAQAPAAVLPWQPEAARHPARLLPAPVPPHGSPNGRGEHPYPLPDTPLVRPYVLACEYGMRPAEVMELRRAGLRAAA